MLRDGQSRLAVDQWMDKLAPKVAGLREALKHIPPPEIAWRSGATLQGDCLHLDMLFQPFEVNVTTFEVCRPDGPALPSFFQSLVLTYLETANGAPLAGRWISFRELPNGTFYHQAFQGYAPDRLTQRWGLNIDGFVAACQALGGTRLALGDAGFAWRVFPRVEMAAVYWLGDVREPPQRRTACWAGESNDEDFSSRASILFDASAHHYMVTDGLAILGSQLVGKILKAG